MATYRSLLITLLSIFVLATTPFSYADNNVTTSAKKIDITSIPLDYAFKKVQGNGERLLYVFSDIDCPYCVKLEFILKEIDNVTIYTFLLPLPSIHPEGILKSKLIWCSKNQTQAWDHYFESKGNLPENTADCENPIANIRALATSY